MQDSNAKTFHPDRMNITIRDKVFYAVRGEIVIRAEELAAQIRTNPTNHGLPFNEIIFCNIGNPQSLKQKPLTFVRQVLSLLQFPELLEDPPSIFKADAVARAKAYLKSFPGLGAYTNSKGLEVVRREVAAFIEQRDGFPAHHDDIFLTEGASGGVKSILNALIRDEKDGILIPIPQYPLYSATIPLFGGTALHYYLNEDDGWALNVSEVEKEVKRAREAGITPRGMVVINPGNPTGQTLDVKNMEEIVKFCVREKLLLMADEVYQQNCYEPSKPFVSFKKVVRSLGEITANFELVSFHSISKGVTGECGQRGGYMELVGIHSKVKEQLYKMASVSLCSNTSGQILIGMMVNPPKQGDKSYEIHTQECKAIFDSLARRAKKLAGILNKMEGVSCNPPEGAMYLFPQIRLPSRAVEEAKKRNIAPDMFYVLELLNQTGIVVVPGSGFGQVAGTYHFRTTFLPPEDKIDTVAEKMSEFHASFLKTWS